MGVAGTVASVVVDCRALIRTLVQVAPYDEGMFCRLASRVLGGVN